jgi:'Cold-shock' DNA-binding domain
LHRLNPQTSIQTDGYRSLREAEEVEFDVESGDDGRTKAVNVTGPGGAPPLVRAPALPECPFSLSVGSRCAVNLMTWLWHRCYQTVPPYDACARCSTGSPVACTVLHATDRSTETHVAVITGRW